MKIYLERRHWTRAVQLARRNINTSEQVLGDMCSFHAHGSLVRRFHNGDRERRLSIRVNAPLNATWTTCSLMN